MSSENDESLKRIPKETAIENKPENDKPEKTTKENNTVAAPDGNNDKGSTKDSPNYDSDDEELKTLEKTAMRSLGPIATNAIDTMKGYGRKAIPYLLRIANGHRSPRIRLYALHAARELKK